MLAREDLQGSKLKAPPLALQMTTALVPNPGTKAARIYNASLAAREVALLTSLERERVSTLSIEDARDRLGVRAKKDVSSLSRKGALQLWNAETLSGVQGSSTATASLGGRFVVGAATMFRMSVATGVIRNGQLVLEGEHEEPLPEGRPFIVFFQSNEVEELDEETEDGLLEAMAQLDRGEGRPMRELIDELKAKK